MSNKDCKRGKEGIVGRERPTAMTKRELRSRWAWSVKEGNGNDNDNGTCESKGEDNDESNGENHGEGNGAELSVTSHRPL